MNIENVSEIAMTIAISFRPFINPKCQEHDKIVEDMAKSIQYCMNKAAQGKITYNKLAASAPDLLAALIKFQDEWVVGGTPAQRANNYSIEQQIKAAIIKATSEKKIAPYLKISGADVELGAKYYTVDLNNFTVAEHTAGNENNVMSKAYFYQLTNADTYSKMLSLQYTLNQHISAIKTIL